MKIKAMALKIVRKVQAHVPGLQGPPLSRSPAFHLGASLYLRSSYTGPCGTTRTSTWPVILISKPQRAFATFPSRNTGPKILPGLVLNILTFH